ncbi:MAG: BadF/BadG/BcrA/BcrD ATPase family protein, partial [Pseudolysinimonas sp.]
TTAPITREDNNRLCELIARATQASQIWVMDDSVSTHAGALSGGWGISLVVGTGVGCLVVSQDRTGARVVDGHGFLLGDDGGGFWIGSRGLRGVLRAADGRGATTRLTESAIERFGQIEGLHVRLHSADRAVNSIAQFARDVLSAAEDGDELATHVVADAVAQLAITVRAAASFAASEVAIPLALGGRLVARGTLLRRRLDERLLIEQPMVAARSADHGALEGTIRLGSGELPAEYRALVHIWKRGTAA